MNSTMLKRSFHQVVAWSAVVVLSAVVAIAQDAPAPAEQRTDGQIEMDVVHALDASQALKNDLITAATIQSEVTLSGTVSSEASQKLAASIAGQVAGVTKVNNNLKVGNPQDAQAAQDAAAPPAPSDDPGQSQQQAGIQPDQGSMPPPQTYPQPQGQYPQQPQDQYPQAQGQYPQQPQGQYPQGQGGGYPPPYPPARPQYAPYPQQGYGQQQQGYNQPQQPAYQMPSGPVTIPPGTLLQVRTNEGVATRGAKDGQPVQFTLITDVTSGGVLAIPRGATLHGVVTESKKAGELGGSAVLALTLTSLDLGGQNYPINSDQFRVKGPNKAGETVGNTVGGALIGTIIGCAVGRGVGCAVGAGAGAAGGAALTAATPGPGVWIPAEALVTFHITDPITVNPVSQQEAARLAQGLYPGGPSLYRRPAYGYPYGPRYYTGYPYWLPARLLPPLLHRWRLLLLALNLRQHHSTQAGVLNQDARFCFAPRSSQQPKARSCSFPTPSNPTIQHSLPSSIMAVTRIERELRFRACVPYHPAPRRTRSQPRSRVES